MNWSLFWQHWLLFSIYSLLYSLFLNHCLKSCDKSQFPFGKQQIRLVRFVKPERIARYWHFASLCSYLIYRKLVNILAFLSIWSLLLDFHQLKWQSLLPWLAYFQCLHRFAHFFYSCPIYSNQNLFFTSLLCRLYYYRRSFDALEVRTQSWLDLYLKCYKWFVTDWDQILGMGKFTTFSHD